MCPGVPGNVSGTLLGRISRSSNTTPGVLALTLMPRGGSAKALAEVDSAVGSERCDRLARLPIERPQEVAIGHQHSIGVHGDTAMTKSRTRGRTAAWIELPDFGAGLRIERDDLHRRRRHVEQAVDDDGVALHFGGFERVMAVVGPGDLQLVNVRQA